VQAGRPREFDVNQVLDRALHVFWRKGYEGATLPDLTKAMGINRPSLYAAFGSKEGLFRKALDRYDEGPAAYVREGLNEPTARAVAQRLLEGAIDVMTDRRNPRGCLMVQGALACGEAEGIPLHITQHAIKVLILLDRKSLEAIWIDVTAAGHLVMLLPAHRVRQGQPTQEAAEFPVGCRVQDHVPVGGHQAKPTLWRRANMQSPASPSGPCGGSSPGG
jgi:AcrR family transcriptional regulator